MSAETIYWTACRSTDVPDDDDWLTAREQARLSAFFIPKRRCDWRLGRWTAKNAIRALEALEGKRIGLHAIEIEVLPSGAPRALVGASAFNISISHRNGTGVCVVGRSRLPFGCDIETIEARNEVFVADYFTPEEQALIADVRNQKDCAQTLVALFWSAKESALKALQLGLNYPLSSLNVRTEPLKIFYDHSLENTNSLTWMPVQVSIENRLTMAGFWARQEHFILTIVAAAATFEVAKL